MSISDWSSDVCFSDLQTQRELNYMLVDVFELLSVRQQGFAAYGAYIDALRDYWIARAALARAVGRRLPSTPEAPEALSFDLSRPQLDATPDTQTPAAMPMPAMPGQHLLHQDRPYKRRARQKGGTTGRSREV